MKNGIIFVAELSFKVAESSHPAWSSSGAPGGTFTLSSVTTFLLRFPSCDSCGAASEFSPRRPPGRFGRDRNLLRPSAYLHRGCAGWERRIKGVVSEECQCCLSGRFCFVRDWLDNKNRDRSKKAAPEKNAELPPPIRDRIPPRDPPINYSLRWNAPSCDGGEQKNTSRPLLPRRIAALGGRRGPSASFPTAEIISWHGPGLLAV
ncbi:hypothetical protein GEV33_003403 [Tenebrio molitor]|uniref:Uncharacterized protein n=1 Tax=Tenebrio molitor TaxID=7067 RepID=A0A8J6HSE3_TENMO|nr:hypothetical protein GEV33_003403 [Tenebrio molitor]